MRSPLAQGVGSAVTTLVVAGSATLMFLSVASGTASTVIRMQRVSRRCKQGCSRQAQYTAQRLMLLYEAAVRGYVSCCRHGTPNPAEHAAARGIFLVRYASVRQYSTGYLLVTGLQLAPPSVRCVEDREGRSA